MNDRDKRVADAMLRHCEEIIDTLKRFDASRKQFQSDHVFYNACCMSLFQIGELSKRMSERFKEEHPELPWSEMRGIRNLFAHEYESADKDLGSTDKFGTTILTHLFRPLFVSKSST